MQWHCSTRYFDCVKHDILQLSETYRKPVWFEQNWWYIFLFTSPSYQTCSTGLHHLQTVYQKEVKLDVFQYEKASIIRQHKRHWVLREVTINHYLGICITTQKEIRTEQFWWLHIKNANNSQPLTHVSRNRILTLNTGMGDNTKCQVVD